MVSIKDSEATHFTPLSSSFLNYTLVVITPALATLWDCLGCVNGITYMKPLWRTLQHSMNGWSCYYLYLSPAVRTGDCWGSMNLVCRKLPGTNLFSSIFLSAPLETGHSKNVFVGRTGIKAITSVGQHRQTELKIPDLNLVLVGYCCITTNPKISVANSKSKYFSIMGLQVSWGSFVTALLSYLLSEPVFSAVKYK